ncbi:MAG TPA: trypsin-like peptidase domain-containing protein [Mycobacterium sp.]|nr:trypsin-like peptidase domain-containing protein [Mycobacterium sp.]
MRTIRVLLCLLAGLAPLLMSCSRPAGHGLVSPAPQPRPSVPAQQLGDPGRGGVAGPVDPDPRVGAVFFDGGNRHSCTASVVHSKGGDLVLTAAHCLSGGSQAGFVPGFAGNSGDMWTLNEVYFDPRWLAGRDPHADYAIARVNSEAGGSVESHVGLALMLGTAPPPGSHVTVLGYPAGVGGSPIGCQAATSVNDSGFPSVACEGLVGGTSGSPWVSGTTITGLIGGFERGGCAENVSYSAPFDEHIAQLLARAEAGGPGDTVPSDLVDTC